MINYRWLSPEEAETLKPIFEEYDGDFPNLQLSAFYGAVNDQNEIVGFHVIQLVPHAEPQWVKEEYRGKVNWREFQRGIEEILRGGEYFIFPSNERIAKLCKRGGMEEVPLKAFKKMVGNK